MSCFAVIAGLSLAFASEFGAPSLEADGDSRAGHLELSWNARGESPGTQYQLETATAAGFGDGRIIYQGSHRASVRSGLLDGIRFFRVRLGDGSRWGPWSTAIRVDVRHYPERLAGALFALGALVFMCTLGFLVVMNRRHRV